MDEETRALIAQLQALLPQLQERKTALDTAIANASQGTEALQTEVTALSTEVQSLKTQITEAMAQSQRPDLNPDATAAAAAAASAATIEERMGGYARSQDFFEAFLSRAARRDDERLGRLEQRALSMGIGAEGGFLVPPQFRDELLAISGPASLFRPRATVIPAGDPPDAEISVPAFDQSGAKGALGGIEVEWIAEAGDKPETDAKFRLITLKPEEVAGFITVTDKLLRNAPAAAQFVQNLLPQAIRLAEDRAFFQGDGIGKPLGFLGHPSAIAIARAGAGAVAHADVVNMFSRMMFDGGAGGYVWILSQTVIPDFATMVDAGNHLVWQPNAREGVPGTIMGMPYVICSHSPTLGNLGDVVLANLSYYLIKDGSPLRVTDDGGILNFKKNKTLVKAYWAVDGEPWLTSPIMLEDGATTVSPFLVLQ